jgi:hypothetical protein
LKSNQNSFKVQLSLFEDDTFNSNVKIDFSNRDRESDVYLFDEKFNQNVKVFYWFC